MLIGDPMHPDPGSPCAIDTVRLTGQQVHAVVDQLIVRQAQRPPANGERRAVAPRKNFDTKRPVIMSLELAGGNINRYQVYVWNISATGVALLHGTFVYNNTPCVVTLPQFNNQPIDLPGRVVRRGLITGRIHELGIHFDYPIELSDFVPHSSPVIAATEEKGPDWNNSTLRPVLTSFVSQLPLLLNDIDPNQPESSPGAHARAVEQLREIANTLGFKTIATASLELAGVRGTEEDVQSLIGKFHLLREICGKTEVPAASDSPVPAQ